jgi:hypothetical protein
MKPTSRENDGALRTRVLRKRLRLVALVLAPDHDNRPDDQEVGQPTAS